MNDQEKSVLLLTAIGLEVMKTQYGDPELWRDGSGHVHAVNIYSPAHWRLAWQAHEWMIKRENGNRESPYHMSDKPYTKWWADWHPWIRENTQCLFLDKIVELLNLAEEKNDG